MASTYNSLGYQLMATGENAGTWGAKTNTTLDELKETFGYQSIAMTADRTLTIPNGATGTYDGRAFILELTGTLGGTRVLDIAVQAGDPAANIEKPFIVFDNTTHSGDTLTFKATGATGFALTEGSTYLCYHNGTDIINTGLTAAAGDVTLTGTQTLTNKTLTSPKIGTDILDTGGNELMKITVTGSAENEFTMAAGASGAGPTLSSTGSSDTNIDMNINPLGTGVLKSGTAAVKIAGKETIWVPAPAMYAATTNGAEAGQAELTAGNPELKTFDFDASTAESVQFNVSFPKSWNESTVTFQTFWSASATDTGTGGFTLAGVSIANNIDYDTAFGTPVANTALAASGTQDDLMVNVESGDITIASAAAATNTIFRLVRDTGTDTNTGDLRLVGIKIFYTTDAANDA